MGGGRELEGRWDGGKSTRLALSLTGHSAHDPTMARRWWHGEVGVGKQVWENNQFCKRRVEETCPSSTYGNLNSTWEAGVGETHRDRVT